MVSYRNFSDMRGRSPRIEFWCFASALGILAGLYLMLRYVLDLTANSGPFSQDIAESRVTQLAEMMLATLRVISFFSIIPACTLTIRRFHDCGLSGLWVAGLTTLLLFPPLSYISLLLLLCVGVLQGQNGNNRWGVDPFGPFNETAPPVQASRRPF